jgi:secreted trypsin-like serine protease
MATRKRQYGWMVRLSVGCDGTLVTPRVVLTAAHCVDESGPTHSIQVSAGSPNLKLAVTVSSAFVKVAPHFSDATRGDDWALIKLAKPLHEPVLALTPSRAYDRGLFRVIGWGSTQEDGAQQTVLRSALVPFVPDRRCGKAYRHISYVNGQMLCAGNIAHGGVDACDGDSGGPLVRRDVDGKYVEVGIVSWGLGCGRPGFPGVYTQISTFGPAIRAAVAKLR